MKNKAFLLTLICLLIVTSAYAISSVDEICESSNRIFYDRREIEMDFTLEEDGCVYHTEKQVLYIPTTSLNKRLLFARHLSSEEDYDTISIYDINKNDKRELSSVEGLDAEAYLDLPENKIEGTYLFDKKDSSLFWSAFANDTNSIIFIITSRISSGYNETYYPKEGTTFHNLTYTMPFVNSSYELTLNLMGGNNVELNRIEDITCPTNFEKRVFKNRVKCMGHIEYNNATIQKVNLRVRLRGDIVSYRDAILANREKKEEIDRRTQDTILGAVIGAIIAGLVGIFTVSYGEHKKKDMIIRESIYKQIHSNLVYIKNFVKNTAGSFDRDYLTKPWYDIKSDGRYLDLPEELYNNLDSLYSKRLDEHFQARLTLLNAVESISKLKLEEAYSGNRTADIKKRIEQNVGYIRVPILEYIDGLADAIVLSESNEKNLLEGEFKFDEKIKLSLVEDIDKNEDVQKVKQEREKTVKIIEQLLETVKQKLASAGISQKIKRVLKR